MTQTLRTSIRTLGRILPLVVGLALVAASAWAAGYDSALKNVQGLNAIYEVSQGDPKMSNLIFWAVRDSYQAPAVQALPNRPHVAVVFHGPAVKLLTTDKSLWSGADAAEVEKFQATLQQMKQDGVTLEVCRYAVKVMGLDPAIIIPTIDVVDNGFVSVIGYQMQGYAVVRVP